MFATVLIANRGEIAVRVARTCRELGVRTVAVYSTADADSAVVRYADEAVQIGPPPARRSYMSMAAIIEAALQTGADAIHPGYGFLSEDQDFAEVCEAHGVTFIGPSPTVMARLGDKALARAIMADAGLPVLPGSRTPLDNAADAKECADQTGYPVMIKAVSGGGGRGMRVVHAPRDFLRTYKEARAVAQATFGDGRVYVERFLEAARHVEVQVLCDRQGTGIHLGERDCTVQRRQQKLIEESPAPELPDGLGSRISEAAMRGALAVGYSGAGTFEFLVDETGAFHFLEVNCRIQVEHPVTEMVTGIDIVREQLRVAAGYPLAYGQSDVERRGVAIECRVNAEDPERGFMPAAGNLEEFVPPGGPFVRVDTHAFPGFRVSSDYDSLLAKVVVWAPNRYDAIARMDRALHEFRVSGPGVRTTIKFLSEVLSNPLFLHAKHTTSLVERLLDERLGHKR
jgi:acetyl-CoA carboxylase, biotin carboxylase subunit